MVATRAQYTLWRAIYKNWAVKKCPRDNFADIEVHLVKEVFNTDRFSFVVVEVINR